MAFLYTLLTHTYEVTINLISNEKLCKDNQVYVKFNPYSFSIKDLHSMEIKAKCISQYGLYKVQSGFSSSTLSDNGPISFLNSLEKWHSRLGHPSFPIVKTLLHQQNISNITSNSDKDGFLFCKYCQLDKAHCLLLVSSHDRVQQHFALLYIDLWKLLGVLVQLKSTLCLL